jgi:[ribosomal protein S5]-alanine N-acetyltransferase
MRLPVNDTFHLTEFRRSDAPGLVELLHDRAVYEWTLRIPYPYTLADADSYLARAVGRVPVDGPPSAFAVRDAADRVVGVCGLEGPAPCGHHRAEIGYWLGRPYWGHGLATAVVRTVCAFAFEELGLVRLVAHVFADNHASARVLEKNGFRQEGYLIRHYCKDGRFIDARLYARVL